MKKLASLFLFIFLLISQISYASLTYTGLTYESMGSETAVFGFVSMDNSYPTGGEVVTPSAIGLMSISQIVISPKSGYTFAYDVANKKLLAYQVGGFTPAGTISAPVFTGTSPISALNLSAPAFSGVGLTAAGQVITTTDNQTMTLNQCAGMWLISATGATPPNLILSNTAVNAAPAVLTVQGAANTDAGAYKIAKALTPVGTNSVPVFTGAAGSAGLLSQVANTTNLSSVTLIPFIAIGRQ